MGKHAAEHITEIAPLTSDSVAPASRPRLHHSRAKLFLFAFAAAFGFLLVNVVDPYTGAAAAVQVSPREAARVVTLPTQSLVVAGDYERTVTRDSFTVTEPPPPPPPPPPPEEDSGSGDSGGGFSPPPDAAVPDPGSAQAYARSALAARGFGGDEFSCLVALWNRESGWRVNAYNESSGAYGIPQALPGSKMASAGADWRTNAQTQVNWGLGYIIGRYGSPCGAWSHSENVGWY